MNDVPTMGSPPMPTHVDCPKPTLPSCQAASYVSVPLRLINPTGPG